jgi:glyoxylase I family protein
MSLLETREAVQARPHLTGSSATGGHSPGGGEVGHHLFLALGADRLRCVPSISGRVEVNLTVRDPAMSAAWYSELLGLQLLYDYAGDDGRLHYIALVEPESQFVLALVGHQEHSGEQFSEFRTGLDHLEFLVDRREDLNGWAERLDGLGIPHSGVKAPGYTRNAMVTFRDPDNIQLEFFWRAPTR